MKNLFTVTAIMEAGAGAVLLAFPAQPVAYLLGSSMDTPAAVIIGRIAGVALLSLAVTCWLARNDAHSPAASGIIAALLFYNVAAAVLLGMAGLRPESAHGIVWVLALLHASMAVWCVARLRNNRAGD